MSLTYLRNAPSSCNTQLRWVWGAVCATSLFLAAGCSTVPQYVRGDVATRSTAPIPRGATYRILRSHSASPSERALTSQLDSLLQGFGLEPETTESSADIWVEIAHAISDEVVSSSRLWRESAALFDAPSSRRQRFAVQVSRPDNGERSGQVLWRGEVVSSGADRDPATLGDPFLRLVLSKFGREHAPSSFSFRVDESAASARNARTATRPRLAPQPAAATASNEAAPELELPDAPALEAQAVEAAREVPVEAAVVAATAPVEMLLAPEPIVDASGSGSGSAIAEAATALEAAPVDEALAAEEPEPVEEAKKAGEAAPAPEEATRVAEELALPVEQPAPAVEEAAPAEVRGATEVVAAAEPARAPIAEPALKTPRATAGAKVGREPKTMFDALFGTQPKRRLARPTATKPTPAPQPAAEPTPAAESTPSAPKAHAAPTPSQPASQSGATREKPRVAPPGERPPPVPRRAASAPVADALPAEPEFADVGPTWRDAVDVCAQLTERDDVTCSIYVEVLSSSPHLEFQYMSSDSAQANWETDARTAGGPFCVTAARHGLYGSARVVVRAEGAIAQRSCKELPR